MTRLTTVCTRLAVAALSVALLANDARDPGPRSARIAVTARRTADVRTLEPGSRVERQLSPDEEHPYRLALRAGEYASVIVDQIGIDATAHIRGADGRTIAEIDDEVRTGHVERVAVVADTSGSYTLAIGAARGSRARGSYAIRVAANRPATDVDRSMDESRKLRSAAARSEIEGRFEEARRSLERALTLAEAASGANAVESAIVTAQLAGVYRKLADARESECLYERAIDTMDRTLGPAHPLTALTRSQLAALYQRQGDRRKAEALIRQALDVIEQTLGTQHPWFVSCLATLGNLRDGAGDLAEEEAVVRRALAITEAIGDTESLQYAALLNNLGEVYRQKQDYTRAEELLRRSLALGERLVGPDNYSVAASLQNLGIVARERKDYPTAVAYNMRALSIRERTVGPDHPDVAHILTNLANIYRATGAYGRSLDTHRRALRIWENAAGPYRQATLLSVGNIAKTYAAMGDIANAIAYQRRSDVIVEKQLALNLAVGSERQKLLFVQGMAERTDRTISLHLREAPDHPDAAALAALVLLQRKGRVLDAVIDTFAAVRERIAKTSDRGLLDRLNATTADLARLALNAPVVRRPEARVRAIAALEANKERLEAELADHSAEFRAHVQPVTLDAVQAALPPGSALLEFTIFRPFDPTAARNGEAYGPPRYAAYVVRPQAPPRGFDLGPADAIDRAIDLLRQALRDPARADVVEKARAVDALVMAPLRASIGGATRLLISPDGELNLVPFEALVAEDGRYLIRRYSMSYLTSGRDLLRMRPARARRGRPVIFADPVFGEPAVTNVAQPIDRLAANVENRGSVTTGENLSSVYFAPLAATADEARAIKALFPDAVLFTRHGATKAALRRVSAPRMLHIASHGFFLEDAHLVIQNPLLRSGLALAGANLTHDSTDDGLLTALEASSLNLRGTKLVTLSACDTGVGEVRNGEGVYGLRRAFVLAGAETVVMSLWPVSDTIARETMVAYYTGLRKGRGRGDALRRAKLQMLDRGRRLHPFYWASFIQSGEWATLDGRR
jgi:CHAT domain-containing protein/Tfp pilus assembly protein PilF